MGFNKKISRQSKVKFNDINHELEGSNDESVIEQIEEDIEDLGSDIGNINHLLVNNACPNLLNPLNVFNQSSRCTMEYNQLYGSIVLSSTQTDAMFIMFPEQNLTTFPKYYLRIESFMFADVENVKVKFYYDATHYEEYEIADAETVITGTINQSNFVKIVISFDSLDDTSGGDLGLFVQVSGVPITSFTPYYFDNKSLSELITSKPQLKSVNFSGTTSASGGNLTIADSSSYIPVFATCTDGTSGLSAHIYKKDAESNVVLHVCGNDTSSTVKTETTVSGTLYYF